MVLIYGEPTVGDGYSTHEISWEQCYSMCYWDANCSLSYHYSSQCKLYAYGDYTIKNLNSSAGKLIGMKRNLTTDTCPSNPVAGTDSFNNNCIVYRNNIISNRIYWSITYSITLECESCGTQLFRRDNYWVCVGVKLFPGCGTYWDAMKLCKEDGWESISGPFNIEKMKYFLSQRGGNKKGFRPFLWVDSIKGNLQDITHDGYIPELLQFSSLSAEKCGYIGHSYLPLKISPYDCPEYKTGEDCFSGAACLKRYLEIN